MQERVADHCVRLQAKADHLVEEAEGRVLITADTVAFRETGISDGVWQATVLLHV